MLGVGKKQGQFLANLLMTVLVIQGRVNYRNLGRHGQYHERTYRRWFKKDFDFAAFNSACMEQRKTKGELIAALDASYIPKSGKHTDGIGKFYDGCVSKVRKGLEISSMALIDRKSRQAFSFDSQQTLDDDLASEESRVHSYANHVIRCAPKLPSEVRYLAVDGFYAKRNFLDPVCEATSLHIIGKLRCDADLHYIHQRDPEEPKRRGRPKLYDGKVNLKAPDLSRWHYEGEIETDVQLWSTTLYHKGLKRKFKIAMIRDEKRGKHYLFFSTDLNLAATEIIEIYRLRFQMEFLFRDAKQSTGLTTCQARDKQAMNFHFNMALSTVNVAKIDLYNQHQADTPFVFSLSAYCHHLFNHRLLERFLDNSELELSCPKIQQALHYALAFGMPEG